MKPPLKVVLYRYSSAPPSRRLDAWLAGQISPPAEVWDSQPHRPALAELRAAVGRGEVWRLVVPSVGHIGGLRPEVFDFLHECGRNGVEVTFLAEAAQLPPDAGPVVSAILSLAESVTAGLRARQRAGIARAKAAGKTWGGRQPGTRVRLTEEKEAEIRRMRAVGLSASGIADAVGLSRSTVYRTLAAGTSPK